MGKVQEGGSPHLAGGGLGDIPPNFDVDALCRPAFWEMFGIYVIRKDMILHQ